MRQVQGPPVLVVEAGAGRGVGLASIRGLGTDGFSLGVGKGDFTDTGPVALVVACSGNAEVTALPLLFSTVSSLLLFWPEVLSSMVVQRFPSLELSSLKRWLFCFSHRMLMFFTSTGRPMSTVSFSPLLPPSAHQRVDLSPSTALSAGCRLLHSLPWRIPGLFPVPAGCAVRHFAEAGEFPVPVQALRFGGIQGSAHQGGDAECPSGRGSYV